MIVKIIKLFSAIIFGFMILGCRTNTTSTNTHYNDLEEVKRIERQRIISQYLSDYTINQQNLNQTDNNSNNINYPAGNYNHIIFSPRYTNNTNLGEPVR